MPTTERRRRVPPRGNPEGEAPPQPGYTQQVARIPWLTLILTTGLTTLTGYAFIELAKGAHRAIKRRREDKAAAILSETNPPRKELPAPGVKPDGTFHLPVPGAEYEPGTVPSHVGFGAPGPVPASPYAHPLTDVSTPTGQLRHEVKSLQYNVDGRLARIEAMLAGHYQNEGRG